MLRSLLLALAVLAALPATAQRSIDLDDRVSGRLRAGAPARWSIEVSRPTTITVGVESDDFDPIVEVLDPSGGQIGRDDDGGDGLNSLLQELRLPRRGRYQIVVSGFSSSAAGDYVLDVRSGRDDGRPESRTIRYDESRTGYLNAGERHEWRFSGSAGDMVAIDLTGSFDTYLELYAPGGGEVARDDDGGDGSAARIGWVRLPSTGRYTVVARGFSTSGSGSYTLALSREGGGRPSSECSGWADYGLTRLSLSVRRDTTVGGGGDNWATGMNAFVGRDATVTRLAGTDSDGCTVVHVDADGGTYMWRLRDQTVMPRRTGSRLPTGAACRQGGAPDYAGVRVGTEVTLGRHEVVNGSDNWADEMEAYVGRRTRVSELGGVDEQGCAVVRVEADGGEWMWRVRDAVRW